MVQIGDKALWQDDLGFKLVLSTRSNVHTDIRLLLKDLHHVNVSCSLLVLYFFTGVNKAEFSLFFLFFFLHINLGGLILKIHHNIGVV